MQKPAMWSQFVCYLLQCSAFADKKIIISKHDRGRNSSVLISTDLRKFADVRSATFSVKSVKIIFDIYLCTFCHVLP